MKTIKITDTNDLLLLTRISTLVSRYNSLFNTAKRLNMPCKMPPLRQSVIIYSQLYNDYAPEFFKKYNIPSGSEIKLDVDNLEVTYEEK